MVVFHFVERKKKSSNVKTISSNLVEGRISLNLVRGPCRLHPVSTLLCMLPSSLAFSPFPLPLCVSCCGSVGLRDRPYNVQYFQYYQADRKRVQCSVCCVSNVTKPCFRPPKPEPNDLCVTVTLHHRNHSNPGDPRPWGLSILE